MKSFARQWSEPMVQFSWVLIVVLAHLWLIVGLAAGLAAYSWAVGVIVSVSLFLLSYLVLVLLWYSSQR